MASFVFNGINIFYEDIGSGEPFLILNGIMMSTASWKMFEEEFSRNNRLIMVDLLEQGQSGKADADFQISLQADLVKALLDFLGIKKVSLMGISYGGEVSLQFAVKYGEYLNKLLLFNTVAYTNNYLKESGAAWVHATHSPEAFYSATIPIIYSPQFYEANIDWMLKRKSLLCRTAFASEAFLNSMVRLVKSANHHDLRGELEKISVPTLIVGSECDMLTPLTEQKYIHQHIKGSELLVMPNCGHASMYEKPMLFVSIVLGFIGVKKIEYVI